jgi:DNA adenine methylase
MAYPGGKGAYFHPIINQQPPHVFYGEPFLGLGSVMCNKRPAPEGQVGIDRDKHALDLFRQKAAAQVLPGLRLLHTNALRWLARNVADLPRDALLYLDPPYLQSAVKTALRYRYILTPDEHKDLLDIILSAPCMVQISGYYSRLYQSKLKGWRSIRFNVNTRGNSWATEYVWMNYRPPVELHTYDHLDFGMGFRKREQLRRKKKRWLGKLEKMQDQERLMLMAAIEDFKGERYGTL